MRKNGNLLYNNFGVILNYMFNLDRLTEIKSKRLPLHIVEKKIPYIDGFMHWHIAVCVKHAQLYAFTRNGTHKFESLILDMSKASLEHMKAIFKTSFFSGQKSCMVRCPVWKWKELHLRDGF